MRTSGTVTWFSEPKGYGYLQAEDGTPVFVHHADIRGEGFRTLRPGWGVTFVMDDDGRGPTARDVAPQARGEGAPQARGEGAPQAGDRGLSGLVGGQSGVMANDTTTTTDHDEIKAWAERHDAVPASPRGTGGDDDPGVLTFDIKGYGADEESLEHLGWDEWLEKFEESDLALLYQDEKKDGEESTFFKLVSRDS